MNTDNRDGWVLLKPEDYLAVPISQFAALMSAAKNIKHEWVRSGDSKSAYSVCPNPMNMMFMTDEQMTAIAVLDRLTRASGPDQSGEGCSTAAAS